MTVIGLTIMETIGIVDHFDKGKFMISKEIGHAIIAVSRVIGKTNVVYALVNIQIMVTILTMNVQMMKPNIIVLG